MKILVAAVSSSSEISGVQRHALNLVRCLLLQPEVSEVHLVIAPWQRRMLESVGPAPEDRLFVHTPSVDRGAIGRNAWYYWKLPLISAQLKVDLVHLTHPVPVDAGAFQCAVVLTLHDLYPFEVPENFPFPRVFFNRFILTRCLSNVDAIACVSEATSVRLQRYFPDIPWPQIDCIQNCVEPEPYCTIHSPIPGWDGEPFLLCVAQHRCNKNIPLLLDVFHALLERGKIRSLTRLVIVGITGPETGRIQRRITRLKLRPNIVLLQGISEPELQWCYNRCEVLIAPSITEGFGLPVAEALLAGCPIVCSDIRAFRELSEMAEGHCHLVSLEHKPESELAEAIVRTIGRQRREPVSLPLLSRRVIGGKYVHLYRGLTAARSSVQQPVSSEPQLQVALQERQSI